MRVVRLTVVALSHLTLLIMSKEVEEALTSFSPMELLKLALWFSAVGKRGNRERQARGPVTLTSPLSLLTPHLTLTE